MFGEVHDIVSTLNMGAQGFPASDIQHIGNYPVEAVRMMSKIIKDSCKIF